MPDAVPSPSRLGPRLVAIAMIALGLNALVQVPQDLPWISDEPGVLWLLQAINAVFGLWGGVGAWRGARWSWKPTLACGATTGGMIASLGPILDLDAEGRKGLFAGAVLVFGVVALFAWYLRRALAQGTRVAATPVETA